MARAMKRSVTKTDLSSLLSVADDLFSQLASLSLDEKVSAINELRLKLMDYSPFATEPVDCVLWVKAGEVQANDYNPNSVAPPEMELLRHSIASDGYTQPIVAWRTSKGFEVVDGFHRHRVGRECKEVSDRINGYLPIVAIKADREGRNDRIASTIRHNRARGKHHVGAMSDIVIELKRRNWSDDKIARELGMDADEVLRLCQITGLSEVFADQQFSKAWDIDDALNSGLAEELTDQSEEPENDKRIFHTWEKWECYRAGFYEEKPKNGMTQEEGEEKYREFLSDLEAFDEALGHVITEWTNSCEHYLTNERMNRIAWLGQAALAYALGVPSCCRGGYNKLTDEQKKAADLMALKYLNEWRAAHELEDLTLDQAVSKTQMDLY